MLERDLYKLIWLSRPLMQAAEASVECGLEGTDLTVRMRAVLEMLHDHGDLSVPDIAARLDIKRQYVQVMVNETMAAELTVQLPNPRHKRSPLVSLTDPGRALIERVMKAELDLVRTLASDFTADDVATALQVVQRITERLKSAAETPR